MSQTDILLIYDPCKIKTFVIVIVIVLPPPPSLSLSFPLCHTCYRLFKGLCHHLHGAAPKTCLWGAGVRLLSSLSSWVRVVDTLTEQLRCPPAVHREVRKSLAIDGSFTPRYSEAAWPAATEGTPIRWLRHDSQPGHGRGKPWDCRQCGLEVGRLLNDLMAGQSGRGHGKEHCTRDCGLEVGRLLNLMMGQSGRCYGSEHCTRDCGLEVGRLLNLMMGQSGRGHGSDHCTCCSNIVYTDIMLIL